MVIVLSEVNVVSFVPEVTVNTQWGFDTTDPGENIDVVSKPSRVLQSFDLYIIDVCTSTRIEGLRSKVHERNNPLLVCELKRQQTIVFTWGCSPFFIQSDSCMSIRC